MENSDPQDPDRYIPKQWIGCDLEAEYFGDDRKMSKKERKIASAKDRSKYKKTDKDKFQRSPEIHKNIKIDRESLSRGRVLSIASEGILVDCEGENFVCKLRGLLKKTKDLSKNLVTVGDFVLFEKTNPSEGSIAHVEPRFSVLSRADNLSRRKEQLIAANMDQVIITVSVVSPNLRPFIVDRYIIAAEKGGMTPIVVINKVDLLNDPTVDEELREVENIIFDDFLKAYAQAGITVIPFSTVTREGLEPLMAVMKDKASVFSGQSGVGKSSLINVLTGLSLRIGKVVDRTNKGSHTTTATQLIPLEFGGWCIDTPGIRSFGVWDLEKEELENYFSEIHEKGLGCRFPNCSHFQQEGCKVIEAVEKEEISSMRYDSYLSLMESIAQKHLRR